MRDPRTLHRDNVGFQPEHEEEYIRMPFAPTPPVSYPAPFSDIRVSRPTQLYDPPSSSSMRDRDRGFDFERSNSKLRRRHSRIPRDRKVRRRQDIEDDAWHAGKVAAVAGLVEVLHVDDGKGDWVGMKGVRVGTTAAATFGATYLRERDAEDYRMREVVADVGTGVLVSGLVYGSARGEERGSRSRTAERPGEKRRWTFCL
ncbi:hypothetical protein VTL71DRAFT_2096 [Oculimacula yallundae]|uniref:Uncharacterized protein n=1 Tax=Oculimacula yallundae TaxID=86028 RepID=A0ABR4C8G0_9HELO